MSGLKEILRAAMTVEQARYVMGVSAAATQSELSAALARTICLLNVDAVTTSTQGALEGMLALLEVARERLTADSERPAVRTGLD